MDWPHFRLGQEDLRARSREPLIYVREYWPLNLLYGSAETLRQYAGLPANVPIPWAVQPLMKMAVGRFMRNPDEPLAKAGVRDLNSADLPLLLTVDADQQQALLASGHENVHVIGSMFHYCREIYHRHVPASPAPVRRGTIVFPDKSDAGKQLNFDRQGYAAKLAALPEEFHPVYVSMHWRDFESGNHEFYQRAGLSVVCSGHPNDPLFYQRFYDICRQFRYACSNEISTSFVLSVLSGCRFFYLDGGPVSIQMWSGLNYQGPEPMLDAPHKQACIQAAPFPPTEESAARQRELAARGSGEEHLKPPAFFHELWEPARSALSRRLTPATMQTVPVMASARFAEWLPAGFDQDGWADQECALEVPARPGFQAVVLRLAFPPCEEGSAARVLSIQLDDEPTSERSFPIHQSEQNITIPLRQDGQRRKIAITGPAAVTLPGEARARALRLAGVEWQSVPVDPTPWDAGATQRQG